MSTPAVYRKLKVESLQQRDPNLCLKNFMNNPCYFNDLEEPAFELLPSLRLFKRNLEALGFQHILLSGSGSAFFCLGDKTNSQSSKSEFEFSGKFISRFDQSWYWAPSLFLCVLCDLLNNKLTASINSTQRHEDTKRRQRF